MDSYTHFLTKLHEWPDQFAIFKGTADWINARYPLLGISPWSAMVIVAGLLIIAVHIGVYLYLYMTRRGVKVGKITTGRFSTPQEIRKYYQLPGAFFFYLNRLLFFLFFPLMILVLANALDGLGILIVSFPALAGVFLVKHYSSFFDYRAFALKLKPFPLGKCNGKRVGVLGGTLRNLFNMRIREKQRQEHVLVIGPTGTGKTTTFFIPGLIEDACSNDSCFVIDIKGDADIVDIVGPEWNKAGKKVIYFDPWKKEERLHFNPLMRLNPDLDDPDTYYTIQTIVDTIYRVNEEQVGRASGDGSYYLGKEKRLVEGMMFAALFHPEEERNIIAVAEALSGTVEAATNFILESIRVSSTTSEKTVKQLYKEVGWFIDKPDSKSDRDNPMDIKSKNDMLTGIHLKLRIFLDPYVKRHFIKDELDLNLMFNEPCLFVIKAPQAQREKGILLAAIITRLVMLKVFDTALERNKRGHNIWMYLDEFASLKLPDIGTFVATVRSSGGGVVAAIQDKEDLLTSTQATARGNSPQSLESNFGTTVLLGGCSIETCERISRGFGEKMVLDRSKIQDMFSPINARLMKRYSRAPLVTPDSLIYQDEAQAMVAPNRKRPFWIKVVPYFRDRKYKKCTDKKIPVVLWKPDLTGPLIAKPVNNLKAAALMTKALELIKPKEQPVASEKIRDTHISPELKQARADHEKFGRDILADYLAQSDSHHHNHKEKF